MTITRIAFATAVALTTVVPAVDAQQTESDTPALARLEQALDADTYKAVAEVINGARARALPIDPLVDRALEGAMKRAPGARIQSAVSTLAQRLEVAKNELEPSPTESDIAAGAGALAVGVPRETLRTIRSIRRDGPVAVPLGVLTELVSRRVPVDRATTIVVGLLRRGATSPQLVALGADVQRDIAAGIEPSAALAIRTRGVASALPGGETVLEGEVLSSPNAPSAPTTAGGGFNADGTPRNTNTRPRVGGTRRP